MSNFGFQISDFKFQVLSFTSLRASLFKFQDWTLFLMIMTLLSCQRIYTPKPNTYFRIDFPDYQLYDSICSFTFEYLVYRIVAPDTYPNSYPYCMNTIFPKYKGTYRLHNKKTLL